MIRHEIDARILPRPDELLNGPHVVRVGTFDDRGLERFRRAMQRAIDADQEVVPVLIDSDGGTMFAEMAMLDEFDAARAAGMRIATIVSGRAQSAAADILAAGDRGLRYAAPLATVMVHDAGDFDPAPGKIEEQRANYEELRREHELLLDRFEGHCGKPRGYFRKIVHDKGHADWFMGAREARKHGIVDHVGLPVLSVTVTVAFELSLPKSARCGGSR